MNGDPRWCVKCNLWLVEPQEFRQRGSRDIDIYCSRCRGAINAEFEVEVAGG